MEKNYINKFNIVFLDWIWQQIAKWLVKFQIFKFNSNT
jgi:hypothetical protein